MCFEVCPCFVGCWAIVPFFNGICEDVGVGDNDAADADELFGSFWGALGLCHCGILVDYVEDVCDGVGMDVGMVDGALASFVEFLIGDVAVGAEKIVHGVLDGASDDAGVFIDEWHHD